MKLQYLNFFTVLPAHTTNLVSFLGNNEPVRLIVLQSADGMNKVFTTFLGVVLQLVTPIKTQRQLHVNRYRTV